MKKTAGILLIAALATSACRQPKELIYQNVERFSLQQEGLNKTSLSLDLKLYNPNKYRMKIRDADMDILINGNSLGKMTVRENITIPGLDTFLLPVMITVDLQKALPNALQLLLNSLVDVKIQGALKAGRHGLFINMPVNYETKQDIKKGLKF